VIALLHDDLRRGYNQSPIGPAYRIIPELVLVETSFYALPNQTTTYWFANASGDVRKVRPPREDSCELRD
jgi:hypothetical protein